MNKMADCYLLLGTNKENKQENLTIAEKHLEQQIGKIVLKSSVFESEAWGYSDPEPYFNLALKMHSLLTPEALLQECQEIENKMGRIRISNTYEARTIDIDIIFYDSLQLKSAELEIPHPRMHLRRFALEPFQEICPEYVHPLFKKTIAELALCCEDLGWVKKINLQQTKS
jgi:2-amino-4-hydroxy-6-hydroxymethyldihydropteridine diphosphokinase